MFANTNREAELSNADLTPLRHAIDAQSEVLRASAILAKPLSAPPKARCTTKLPSGPSKHPLNSQDSPNKKPFQAMDWYVPHRCFDLNCAQLRNPYGRAKASQCVWPFERSKGGTNRCHIDVMIVAINAVLSHGKDTLRDDVIKHTSGRGLMSEAIQGLFASSTAGTMTTSPPKSLEEHAENLWALLHEASSAKVDKPGDWGCAVSDLASVH